MLSLLDDNIFRAENFFPGLLQTMLSLKLEVMAWPGKRHIVRDRRPGTTACSGGCWAIKVKKCAMTKIIFCTGLTRATKAGQISILLVQ